MAHEPRQIYASTADRRHGRRWNQVSPAGRRHGRRWNRVSPAGRRHGRRWNRVSGADRRPRRSLWVPAAVVALALAAGEALRNLA